jgi:hypothetical protein
MMALAEENRTIAIRYSPAMMMITARRIEQNRGIRHFRKKVTMGPMTREKRKAMTKGRTMGAVIFKTAPPRSSAIKATRKKIALPALNRLKLSLISPSMARFANFVRISPDTLRRRKEK